MAAMVAWDGRYCAVAIAVSLLWPWQGSVGGAHLNCSRGTGSCLSPGPKHGAASLEGGIAWVGGTQSKREEEGEDSGVRIH